MKLQHDMLLKVEISHRTKRVPLVGSWVLFCLGVWSSFAGDFERASYAMAAAAFWRVSAIR